MSAAAGIPIYHLPTSSQHLYKGSYYQYHPTVGQVATGQGARRGAQLLCSHQMPKSTIPCHPAMHIEMQLGRRNWKASSLSKTLGQGDVLSSLPEQEEAAGSSEEPQPPGTDGVDLGRLPDTLQAALLLPLLNSSPSTGAALCKSQTNKSWLRKTHGLLKQSSKPMSPFDKPLFQSTSLGRAKGMVLS